MDFDTIANTFFMVANVLPFEWVGTAFTVIGAIATAGTALSRDGSQYKGKFGKVLQLVLKYGGMNFGKASNKE